MLPRQLSDSTTAAYSNAVECARGEFAWTGLERDPPLSPPSGKRICEGMVVVSSRLDTVDKPHNETFKTGSCGCGDHFGYHVFQARPN